MNKKKRFRNKHILHSVHSIIIITAIDRNFLKTIKNISLSFTNQNASFHYGQIELYTCVIVLEHLTKYAKGFSVILHVHFLPNDFNLNTKYYFKNECEGFIRFPNTRKHLKRPSGFIVFECLET